MTGPSGPALHIGGILLTGGASRRMGVDKATMLIGGTPAARRLAGELSAVADPVLEVGPGVSGLSAVREDPAGEGPLVAVVAGAGALARLGHRGPVLVVACDLPRLTAAVLETLAAWPVEGSVVPEVGGRPQPLCARWSTADLDIARALAEAGERAMHALLEAVSPTLLVVDELEELDERAFADVDSPDDLARLGLATSSDDGLRADEA